MEMFHFNKYCIIASVNRCVNCTHNCGTVSKCKICSRKISSFTKRASFHWQILTAILMLYQMTGLDQTIGERREGQKDKERSGGCVSVFLDSVWMIVPVLTQCL